MLEGKGEFFGQKVFFLYLFHILKSHVYPSFWLKFLEQPLSLKKRERVIMERDGNWFRWIILVLGLCVVYFFFTIVSSIPLVCFFFFAELKDILSMHATKQKLLSDPSQFDCPGISIKKKCKTNGIVILFLPCIHMNMYQPWISFKLSKKTDWLLLQNTRSGVLHLRPHCVVHPIQSRGSSSRPVCKKTCFKTFYGGELKNFPMQTNKHYLIYLFFCMLFLLVFLSKKNF